MKLIRNPRRRHTDGMIGLKFREAPQRMDLDDRLNLRDELVNNKYEVDNINELPPYEKQLHMSLIFDRIQNDEIGEKNTRVFKIDPMDKRYVFENEIKRFMKELKEVEKEKIKQKDNNLSHASAFSSYMEKSKGSNAIFSIERKSNYSSSEDNSLVSVEDDAEFKKFLKTNDGASKAVSKRQTTTMNLSELQDTIQDMQGDGSSDSKSSDSIVQDDSDYMREADYNPNGALIKNPKSNKLFKQKIRENQKKRAMRKAQKKANKMTTGVISKYGTNKNSKL